MTTKEERTRPFLWGAATSSHQIEGDNRHNDWWHWEEQGNIETGERSGKATDHWNRFREDLRLASELGLTSYRFSVEWSRCEPEEGRWDESALEWYRELVSECEKRNLLPMATLHHFTIPQWLAEKGGLLWDHAPDRFAGYTRKVVAAIGSRVPLWCTLNEPNSLAIGSYLGGFMPPAKTSPKLCALATRQLLRAHVKAYDVLHAGTTERSGPWRDYPLGVGIAHNMIDFLPRHPLNPAEVLFARVIRRFYNASWPDAVTGRRQNFGIRGIIPKPRTVWEARGRRTVDFLGVNYYMKVYVCVGPQPQEASFVKSRLPFGIMFKRPGDTVSDLGWAIHPEGLARMIRFLRRYDVPLFVTENGIADASDELRPEYLRSHVDVVNKARAEGTDLRGYYHWSLLDNFEWVKGFTPRFGLFSVDYETFARSARPSAKLFADLIRNEGLWHTARHASNPGTADAAVASQHARSSPHP